MPWIVVHEWVAGILQGKAPLFHPVPPLLLWSEPEMTAIVKVNVEFIWWAVLCLTVAGIATLSRCDWLQQHCSCLPFRYIREKSEHITVTAGLQLRRVVHSVAANIVGAIVGLALLIASHVFVLILQRAMCTEVPGAGTKLFIDASQTCRIGTGLGVIIVLGLAVAGAVLCAAAWAKNIIPSCLPPASANGSALPAFRLDSTRDHRVESKSDDEPEGSSSKLSTLATAGVPDTQAAPAAPAASNAHGGSGWKQHARVGVRFIIVEPFKDNRWWWEAVLMLFRLVSTSRVTIAHTVSHQCYTCPWRTG
jgi:hypothetical protein